MDQCFTFRGGTYGTEFGKAGKPSGDNQVLPGPVPQNRLCFPSFHKSVPHRGFILGTSETGRTKAEPADGYIIVCPT